MVGWRTRCGRPPGGLADREKVPRFLQRLGCHAVDAPARVPQEPARRVAERDEQAVAVRKEATWAEVNGQGRPAEASSASRTRRASRGGRSEDEPGADAAVPRS